MVWKVRGRCLLHVNVCPRLLGHCINEQLAVSVDFDSMNPCCLQVNILFLFKNNSNLLCITFSKDLENTDSMYIVL